MSPCKVFWGLSLPVFSIEALCFMNNNPESSLCSLAAQLNSLKVYTSLCGLIYLLTSSSERWEIWGWFLSLTWKERSLFSEDSGIWQIEQVGHQRPACPMGLVLQGSWMVGHPTCKYCSHPRPGRNSKELHMEWPHVVCACWNLNDFIGRN